MTTATKTPETLTTTAALLPPVPRKEPGWGVLFAKKLLGWEDEARPPAPAAHGSITYGEAAMQRAVDVGVVGVLGALLGQAHKRGLLGAPGSASVDSIGAAVALAISVGAAPSHPTAARIAADVGLTCLAVRAFRFGASEDRDDEEKPPRGRKDSVAQAADGLDL